MNVVSKTLGVFQREHFRISYSKDAGASDRMVHFYLEVLQRKLKKLTVKDN